MSESEIYCPICQRVIAADNIEEVESGEHNGYIFVHDDVPHKNSDIDALKEEIQ